MLTEEHFAIITQRLQQLLDCEAACLILDGPDPGLCHPLLTLLPAASTDKPLSAAAYGSTDLAALLLDERIRACCDMAMQSGRTQCLDNCLFRIDRFDIQSVLVAPLERPMGMLGFCLLVHAQTDGFGRGELNLLKLCLPGIAQTVEEVLRALYASCMQAARRQCSLPEGGQGLSTLTGGETTPFITEEGRKGEDPLKNGFVSMISHELRAPLSAIKGYAGLLQAYSIADTRAQHPAAERPSAPLAEQPAIGLTPARQQHYLNVIVEQANHLEVLINDLLDVSRIQAGKLSLRFVAMDAGSLCQQVAQLMRQRVQQQSPGKYRLDCDVMPDLPPVWADPARVQQVLHNLLENAIKYSPNGGRIELSASLQASPPATIESCVHESSEKPHISMTPGTFLTITIRDSGVGIAEHERARLFKPFIRLTHPATTHVEGAGLGLYITRKLVEAMGGAINLHSCPGEGTLVTITLPLACASKQTSSETEALLAPLIAR